jgi:alcohol dehydrogenase
MQYQSYQLRAGSLKNLQKVHATLPPPAPHEVTVATEAIGLNFADIFAIWGLYGATPPGVFIPGLEYAGTIVQVGAAVATVKVGDKIMGLTRFGAYTTHLNIDHRYVVPLPAGWSFAQGAAYLVQAFTAYYALKELGNLKPGQTVLIHSAAGGVVILAGRIAKKMGAYAIGTVGNSSKVDFLLQEEGYDQVIVRSQNTFTEDLKKSLGGRELNLILDSIGGKYFTMGFNVLAQMGRVVTYGSARYASVGDRPNYLRLLYYFLTRPKVDPQKLPEKNKGVLGFNLIWLYDRVELMNELLIELQAMDIGVPYVGHTFAFDELPAAVKLFMSGKTMGKVVVVVNGRKE